MNYGYQNKQESNSVNGYGSKNSTKNKAVNSKKTEDKAVKNKTTKSCK